MNFFGNRKNSIKAVYEDDLEKYLKSVDLYDKILSKEFQCRFCHTNISLENLEVIIPRGKSIEFICNNKLCLHQA
jgi:hypothetical protein